MTVPPPSPPPPSTPPHPTPPHPTPPRVVLVSQTARYLVKQLLAAERGNKIVGTSAYLANTRGEEKQRSAVGRLEEWFEADAQIAAFRLFGPPLPFTPFPQPQPPPRTLSSAMTGDERRHAA